MRKPCSFAIGVGIGALLLSQVAAAFTCTGTWDDGNKSTTAIVDPATACQGPVEGNLSGSKAVTITLPTDGDPWVVIDDSNAVDAMDGALGGTNFNSVGLSGTWFIDLSRITGGYNNFVLGLKPDGAVVYFLLSGLSGTWSVTNHNNSHAVLYGYVGDNSCCEQDLPEPGSLALLGLGLLALGLGRRREG